MAQRADAVPEDTLGLRLLVARARRRMKLREAARVSGVPASAISRYERDEAEPNASRLRALAVAYGTSVDTLLDLDSVMPSQFTPQNRQAA